MTKIITVANPKGGVGKTTTAIYIATILSKYGKTKFQDTDPQGSATYWVEDIDSLPFDFEITNQRSVGKGAGYDYVVIDTPPQNADVVKTAIEVADFVIIPTSPSGIDLDRVHAVLEYVNENVDYSVLFTLADNRTLSFQHAKGWLEANDVKVFKTFIPKREIIKMSVGKIPNRKDELKDYEKVVEEMRGLL
jgi:ATPases involved in chromosome partitioning